MGWFDEAVSEGVASGVLIAFYEKLGVVPAPALKFIRNPSLKPTTPSERGLKRGLLEVGLLQRSWWRYQATEEGKDLIRSARPVRARSTT